MASRLPLTDEEGEVRELAEEDFKQAIPFSALPESLRTKLSGLKQGGTKQASVKRKVTIRLSQDVVDRFQATGNGWQVRMDEALREWIKTHPIS